MFADQGRFFHDAVRNYKDEMFKEYFSPSIDYRMTSDEQKTFGEICSHITDGVRESVQYHLKTKWKDVGNDISVSVKLIVPSEQVVEEFVLTEDHSSFRSQHGSKGTPLVECGC